jgi:uncharacterized peroxidase-related enzyme
MTFIRTIPPDQAEGPVRTMYDQAAANWGFVPNWAQAFSWRPDVRDAWTTLLNTIRARQTVRQYELATLAAARALHCSYCSLAHGRALAQKVLDASAVTAIMQGGDGEALEPREVAMMAFAEQVARDADAISAADVERLRALGYQDEEIFDIAATAAARCFFSKLLDALGVQADASFRDLDPALRDALTVGRPIEDPIH